MVVKVTDPSLPSCGAQEELVVAVIGELDFGTVPRLDEELVGLIASANEVHLRLDAVTFFDAAGAGALVRAARVCRARNARLILEDPSPPVRRILEITGLSRVLEIRRDATRP
jgi:anti-anti-sigma factor